jgi:hypothetical protein
MVTREELHQIVDWLPEGMLAAGGQAFLDFLKQTDPVLYALITAPEDDEPETEEERAAVEEVYREIQEGKGYWVSHEEVVRRHLELP